ncbi:hypothetical protein K7957_17475 [Sphingomonas yunnanensis]|uniref:COG4705 family protein n=1 Tax=Sphingomonas yunnanensis TaxID=310400 RepID=UPI001CA705F3|nr:hypothetical protein [Sphingomonas yunnanensis]MBY9064730.1 hypothetical protein [Sphingomonas yunnanensis]
MIDKEGHAVAKVPAVTLGYWLIKILATTLGETGGDAVSMSWLGETTPEAGASGLNGYLVGTAIFGVLLVAFVWLQVRARRFHPWLYWATILASTTAGTTLADFATRSLGLGYPGGALLLFALVVAALLLWRRNTGSVDIGRVADRRSEGFYWLTITCSQTLGTALGDWVADSDLGYDGAALVFGAALGLTALLYWRTRVSPVLLFWTAFILTRPLGATVGDYLDKPVAKGGLDLSRPVATLALAATIALLIVVLPQRPAGAPSHNEP